MSWDGKVYDKYRIAHTDGTPLKGKKYFVLRLDSDDPVEAARVSSAMRAYKGEPRNCDRFGGDNAKLQKVYYLERGKEYDPKDPYSRQAYLVGYGNWLLAPATEKKGGNNGNE